MLKISRNNLTIFVCAKITDQGQRNYTTFLGRLEMPVTFDSSQTPPAKKKLLELQAKKRWFFRTIVHHLYGLLAFRIKSLSLPHHLASRLTGLSCGQQNELAPGYNFATQPGATSCSQPAHPRASSGKSLLWGRATTPSVPGLSLPLPGAAGRPCARLSRQESANLCQSRSRK